MKNTIKRIVISAAFAALTVGAIAASALYTISGSLGAGRQDAYNAPLSRGMWTVWADGYGYGGDLDIFVYDSRGNLLGQDIAYDNIPEVTFRLDRSDNVRIVVKNAGTGRVSYEGMVE
jgi:hypothetical protein